MGLIDFVKSAGEKLFGKDDEPAAAADVQTPSIEESQAKILGGAVRAIGVEVEGLDISVAAGTATVRGTVSSQEDREKIVLVVGNTAGIGQVDDQLTVNEPAPEAQFYTVQSGDSLSKIAKEYYGNAMKYPVIFEANKPMLTDPDRIYPGQVLRIPPADSE